MRRARELGARSIRAAKIVARDGRIPGWLRWLVAIALLPIPGPFDEAVLLVAAIPLFIFHRQTMREAWDAARDERARPT